MADKFLKLGLTAWFALIGIFVIAAMLGIPQMLIYKYSGIQLSTTPGSSPTPTQPLPVPSTGGLSCPQLSTSQVLSIINVNQDKPGTSISATDVVYLNRNTGTLNPGGNITKPGSVYSVFGTAANFASALVDGITDCTANPPVSLSQKALDTAVATQPFNSDSVTKNSYPSANQSIGLGSSVTMSIDFVQSSNYLHLSGSDNRFAVYVNATNSTDWDASQMAITWDGSQCTKLSQVSGVQQTTPTSIPGQIIYSAVCTGDFLPVDGATHKMGVRIQAQSAVNPGPQFMNVNFAPIQYYANTITGAIEVGAVKDSGATIQAFQTVQLSLN